MFGLNVSILKWIIIAVVIFVLLSFVNNKMLSNLDEKENFESEQTEKFSEITLKLEEAADKITKAVDTFANKKSGTWKRVTGTPANKDCLFITKEWTNKFMTPDTELDTYIGTLPVIDLEEHEKFFDGEYYYEIETRGYRKQNECYFSADDVAYAFGIKDINRIFRSGNYYYEEHKHYLKYRMPFWADCPKQSNKYYFTYQLTAHTL